MKTAAAIILVLFASISANGQQPIAVGPNVQVSKAKGDQDHNEVILAADPNNAGHLLAASHTLNRKVGGFNVVTYVSFDGGKEWRPTLDVGTEFGYNGDPAAAFGCDGTAYSANLAITGPGLDQHNMQVHRSTDGGKSWLPPTLLHWSDREYVIVDCMSAKYKGRAYIFADGDLQMADGRTSYGGTRVFISKDSGQTFREWDFPPAADGQTSLRLQGAPVLLSDGTFLGPIIENPADGSGRGPTIRVFRSADGGDTFSTPYTVAKLNVPSGGFPNLAVDLSSGPYRDRVYAVWEAPLRERGRDVIQMAYSTDKGTTWSTPIVVNDDDAFADGRKGPDDFMGEVAVNRDGVVGISWYDRRDSANDLDWTERFAASFDGGDTFTPSVKVSEAPFLHDSTKVLPVILNGFGGGSFLKIGSGSVLRISATLGRFFLRGGDTAGLAADADGVFHPLWIDNRTGIAQVWTASVKVNGKAVRNGAADLAALDDITEYVMMKIGDAQLDPKTKTVSGLAYLINTSDETLTGPIVIRVLGDNFGGAEILNADNHKPSQGATWDFTSLLPGNKLEPGKRTDGKRIEFRVPDVRAQAEFPTITAKVFGKLESSRARK